MDNKNRFINPSDVPVDNKAKDIPKVEDVFNVPIDNKGIQEQVEILDVSNDAVQTNNQTGNEIINPANINNPVNNEIPQLVDVNKESKERIIDDDELLNSFIGKNSDKIKGRIYNFSALFFSVIYMFYRKMYFYGIIGIIIYFVLSLIVKNIYFLYLINIVLFFAFNSIYLSFARNKINHFKTSFPHSSMEQLKGLCINKGGTSKFGVVIGFVCMILLSIVFAFMVLIFGITSSLNNFINFNQVLNAQRGIVSSNKSTLKDVYISGYMCMNKKCTIDIEDNGVKKSYSLSTKNDDLLIELKEVQEHITLDIIYSGDTITGYIITNKKSGEDLSNVSSIDELKEKLGYAKTRISTEYMTYVGKGSPGSMALEDRNFSYNTYIFKNSSGITYEMKRDIALPSLSLVEGEKYNITFDTFVAVTSDAYLLLSIN